MTVENISQSISMKVWGPLKQDVALILSEKHLNMLMMIRKRRCAGWPKQVFSRHSIQYVNHTR